MLPPTSTATTCRRSLPTRLSIMLPVYLQTHDADRAWEIGAAAVAWTGIIKLAAAPFAGSIRRFIPAPASMTVFGAAMYSYLALVLLQRVFDQPLVGLVALAIVVTTVLADVPITRWRIPPFIVAWIIPLAAALAVGYVHPGLARRIGHLPFADHPRALTGYGSRMPYMSVIAPMAFYHVLAGHRFAVAAELPPATTMMRAHFWHGTVWARWSAVSPGASCRRWSTPCFPPTRRWGRASAMPCGPPSFSLPWS